MKEELTQRRKGASRCRLEPAWSTLLRSTLPVVDGAGQIVTILRTLENYRTEDTSPEREG